MSSTQITPWWKVMHLRPEIAAAGGADDVRMSLHDAVFGAKGAPTTSSPYTDPVAYASITHPSAGLVELMARIALRLAGPASVTQTAVWRLDQAMGGGKSHGLVGLWHLAAHPRKLAGTDLGKQVSRTVGTIAYKAKVAGDLDNPVCVVLDCDNATAATEDFGPARSLGERFLWRLFDTDYETYKAFAEHTPNKAKLAEALRSVGRPVLVLIDEIMDYIRFAAADDYAAAVKDMAFLRALLDAVNTVERCAAVVVMIDSELDNMALTKEGTELRGELEDLLRRNARTVSVTSGGEFAEIIQCRLFEDPPPKQVVTATAKAFTAVAGTGSWSTKVFKRLGRGTAGDFTSRLGRCYPFAPELIDLAEDEWSHHAGFQKVRSTIRVFAAAVHELTKRAAAGDWSPPLIGSGDLPLDSPPVRDALLHSGLVAEGRTESNLREVAATDIADPQRPDRGTARSIDNSRDQDLDWAEVNPHAAQRAATALFARSLCPRPGGVKGATEIELYAATFVPDGSYTYGDAESVLVTLEPPEGLVSVEIAAGKGKNSPRRWYFETRNTLAMLTRAARQSVPPAERDKAITDRAFALAGDSSGPFDRVICVDGGALPETTDATGKKACIDVLKATGIDNKNQTRLVVLDSRWFSLFNGDDSATREALEAAMGLGPDAMSVAWASSAVFACAHTASRAQARGVATEWLARRAVANMDSVRDDPTMHTEAVKQQHEALNQLDRQVRGCYKHIVYLAPTGEHDRKIEFLRIQQDALTALHGVDVWDELRAASKAARPGELDAKMLLVNLRPNDFGQPLREIRNSFWNNPHKPLLPEGDAELADAIYQAVTADKVVLVDDTGTPYKVHAPGDVNLADPGIRLQRPAPPQDSPDPDDGDVSTEPPPEAAAGTGEGDQPTAPGTGAPSQPTTDGPVSPEPDTGPGGQHWMASITINTDIDATEGNDPLVQLLRELMHAVDAGAITHINQMSSITITADKQTADKLKAAADQAGAQINIKPLWAPRHGRGGTFRRMPLTQPVYDRLRLVFSIRTGVSLAAACYGYFLGVHAPRQLANALSVGLAVGAVALAVAFALSATTKRSRAPEEMLYRDREMARLGAYTLRGAVATTLLTLSYVGLGGAFSQGEHLVALLGAVSALSLSWTFCSMPRVFIRSVTIIAGADDEPPDLGGMWKPLRRLRKEAEWDLRQSPSGWYIAGRPFSAPTDSPTFIAKELALRYGALRSEAHMHYVQLCDMAGQSEASERIDRIVFCLEELDRLRDLEQRMRPLLPQDPKLFRFLL